MTKIDIPNPKLIVPSDNQPFYIQILCFFGVFFYFDLKILVFQLLKEALTKIDIFRLKFPFFWILFHGNRG